MTDSIERQLARRTKPGCECHAPAMGHSFAGEDVSCDCGKSWSSFQTEYAMGEAEVCPLFRRKAEKAERQREQKKLRDAAKALLLGDQGDEGAGGE